MSEWIDFADCGNLKHKNCFVIITGNTKTGKITYKHCRKTKSKRM